MFRIIKTILIVIFLTTCIFVFVGCREPVEQTELSFETVSKDFYSAWEDPANITVNDSYAFDDLITSAGIDIQEDIDFDESTIIAVFMGQQSTGGYEVEIKKIVEGADQITVTFESTEPSEDEMVAQVITSPYHMVKIDQAEKAVVFEEQ